VTSRSSADQRRWSFESAYFQGFFILDHLDHLFIKRNRNEYTRETLGSLFPNTLVWVVRLFRNGGALRRLSIGASPHTQRSVSNEISHP
jgi:hypothetical protein